MQSRWKTLAPIELDRNAEARVEQAIRVACAVSGDVTLLHVVDDDHPAADWPLNALADDRCCVVHRSVLSGSITEVTRRYANDLGADLITLTGGSRRFWKRLWRRSVAADLANSIERPVCLTRIAAGEAPREFSTIISVVELDGTEEALVRFSEALARRCSATLVLLHVLPEISEALLTQGMPGVPLRPLSEDLARRRLGELAAGLSYPHLMSIRSGEESRCVAKAAREHDASVVVIGRRSADAASVTAAENLLARLSCAVISVPVATQMPVREAGRTGTSLEEVGIAPGSGQATTNRPRWS